MKKTIIALASVMFLVSCGGSNSSSTSTDTVIVGTYDDTDTLQPILDSVAHIQDSIQESTEVDGFKK
jgi:hypothetical protein